MSDGVHCPLCAADQARNYASANGRHFFRCTICELTFLAQNQLPSRATERSHYETHNNDPADPRYRAFLDRLAAPLTQRVQPGACGLDYGSGPGPALKVMLGELGYAMTAYDPFFAPDEEALSRTYDFITCTETAEHFHTPALEFERLNLMLRPGGWLGIMTEMRDDTRAFADWWYVRDPTHVCFYHPETLQWLAARFDWHLERPARTVALFQKPVRAS